jgi:hypothetical protein
MRRFSQMRTKYQVMTPKRRFAPRLISRVEDALKPLQRRLQPLAISQAEAGTVVPSHGAVP